MRPIEPALPKSQRPVLIVLSHLRWDFVFQRPQHLLTRAARDFDVVFIEEPLIKGDKPGVEASRRASGVTVVQPTLPENTPEAEALLHQGDIAESYADAAGSRPVYLWYYTPMALAFGHRIAADVVIFDKMDELSSFAFASPQLRALEGALMDSADVVFTGGRSLYAAAKGRNRNLHCLPSSIDAAHFAQARSFTRAEPADLAALPHPRIGYFGVIDERMDLDLVDEVAALRPDWQFVMVGPVVKIDPATLPRAANIHWLGGRDYARLPDYLAHWDLGWMPFALNEATRFISPTKTPEFLAAGLPLMSTPIHDVVEPYGRLGHVEIASHAAQMVAAGDSLLAADASMPARAKRLARVDRYLAGNSWDATWASMLALINAAATPATTKPKPATAAIKETAHV